MGTENMLMLAATALVLAGTLVVFVVQYVRRYGKKHDDGRGPRDDEDRR